VNLDSKRVDAWLAAAVADAERRGLPELKPLLEGLAQSLATLRAADDEQARERDARHDDGNDNARS
jgi:hypothetical protein